MDKEERIKFWKSSASRSSASGFSTICFYLWINCSHLHDNFTTNVALDKEVNVKFWNSSGSDVWIRSPNLYPRSGPDSPWWRSVLFDCSCKIESDRTLTFSCYLCHFVACVPLSMLLLISLTLTNVFQLQLQLIFFSVNFSWQSTLSLSISYSYLKLLVVVSG